VSLASKGLRPIESGAVFRGQSHRVGRVTESLGASVNAPGDLAKHGRSKPCGRVEASYVIRKAIGDKQQHTVTAFSELVVALALVVAAPVRHTSIEKRASHRDEDALLCCLSLPIQHLYLKVRSSQHLYRKRTSHRAEDVPIQWSRPKSFVSLL